MGEGAAGAPGPRAPLTGPPPLPRPPPLVLPVSGSLAPSTPSLCGFASDRPPATDFSVSVAQVQRSQKGGCQGVSCWPSSTGGPGGQSWHRRPCCHSRPARGLADQRSPPAVAAGPVSGGTEQGLPGCTPREEAGCWELCDWGTVCPTCLSQSQRLPSKGSSQETCLSGIPRGRQQPGTL